MLFRSHIRMASSTNPLISENLSDFDSHRRYQTRLIGTTTTINSMFDSLKKKSVTAEDYFLGYKNKYQSNWSVDYSKYL